MGLMAIGWLAATATVIGLLAWAFPAFREFLSLGAWQAPPKLTRSERAARERAARLRERMSREQYRVRTILRGEEGTTTEEIRTCFDLVAPEKDRGLEVRRYDSADGPVIAVEFAVTTEDPTIATRIAGRIVYAAGFLPGPTYAVPA